MYSLPGVATVTHSTSEHLILPVQELEWLSDASFVLKLDRGELDFEPGQFVNVGEPDSIEMREYSIYSGPRDECLEILVRRVDGGMVSPRLAKLRPGDSLRVEGPFGYFTLDKEAQRGPLLWIATGTGVSPFRSFVRGYPGLDYHVLLGVRERTELYNWHDFEARRRTACLSRESGGDFAGRVTDYLRKASIDPRTTCYLCGNSAMIYEAYEILVELGIDTEWIRSEVYY